MHLEYPVEVYLPEFKDRQLLLQGAPSLDQTVPVKTKMAIHHLWNHTSGLSLLTNTRLLSESYAKDKLGPHQRLSKAYERSARPEPDKPYLHGLRPLDLRQPPPPR